MIDTHAHLYAEEFNEDREDMLIRAKNAGINRILLPNIDLSSIESMHLLEKESEGYCLSMMGLHPCSVKSNFHEVLTHLKSWLEARSYIAIGEIGIDLYWDKTTLTIQSEAFEEQLSWGHQYGIPVSIHSRDSTQEVIDILTAQKNMLSGGVMHCFSGTVDQMFTLMELGFYIGIGGSSTYKNTNLVPVIEQAPLDRILLETDAPYLTPVPHRGKRNESAYIPLIAQRVASIKGITIDEIATSTSENATRLFSLQTVPLLS
ncbi:MAG: TatD family hydrolase [Saprospiraceae bacterium]|nr:TatD family hydrolase [Saprospiraceae bacterium]